MILNKDGWQGHAVPSTRVSCDYIMTRGNNSLTSKVIYIVPLDMKGCVYTLHSGRYTLSYPTGRYIDAQRNNIIQIITTKV